MNQSNLSKNIENTEAQMRKGTLEFSILLIISSQPAYASDILKDLKENELIVVEGTLYPLLNRLKRQELVRYKWVESNSGPPRKYYELTELGSQALNKLSKNWESLSQSINKLKKKHGTNN